MLLPLCFTNVYYKECESLVCYKLRRRVQDKSVRQLSHYKLDKVISNSERYGKLR